ncbi:MAG: hypothetical protein WBC04_18455 [Candidatus Acidiferrales bacterium]
MYLVGWIEACTGRKHYKNLQTLAVATFAVVEPRRKSPEWVDRLEIEMHRKRQKRRRWIKSISA